MDDGLTSREVAIAQGHRFNKPVKKSFTYGTGYGHYPNPDDHEDLETSQYLTDLEQFYNYWFGG